jgi:hypothetical protein
MTNLQSEAANTKFNTDNAMLSAFWIIYHRAHYLFEQGTLDKRFVFDECCAFRDRLFTETGSTFVPDQAPEKLPSVNVAMILAYAHVRWLKAEVGKRTLVKH